MENILSSLLELSRDCSFPYDGDRYLFFLTAAPSTAEFCATAMVAWLKPVDPDIILVDAEFLYVFLLSQNRQAGLDLQKRFSAQFSQNQDLLGYNFFQNSRSFSSG
mmetsp:Transcript_96545/g.144473  ORF Transcript_96545/g.144473 Transcript_96545/m.144473 type:complete len:106 (-) Transcript_96545:295-612(-)